MLLTVHSRLLHEALSGQMSARALQAVESANLAQDRLRYQVGHDEFHFDNNAIAAGHRYVEQQRSLLLAELERSAAPAAWAAFGRLTHAAQDFYSHTNYVPLWLARHSHGAAVSPRDIDPLDPQLMGSPALCSGKLYYPLEALYFVPALRRLVLGMLPRDSHAHMNIDSEERGWFFDYAFSAALKRTRLEFDQAGQRLSPESFVAFCDLGDPA